MMLQDIRVKRRKAAAPADAAIGNSLEQLQNIEDRFAVGAQWLRAALERIEDLETRLAQAEASAASAWRERDSVANDLEHVQAQLAEVNRRFLDFTRTEIERTRKEITLLSAAITNVHNGRLWRVKGLIGRLLHGRPR